MIAATGWRNNRWANRYPAGVTCKRERSQVRARNASGGGRAAKQPDRIHVGWCAIGARCDLLHHMVCHSRLQVESNGRRSAGGGLGGERAVLLLPLCCYCCSLPTCSTPYRTLSVLYGCTYISTVKSSYTLPDMETQLCIFIFLHIEIQSFTVYSCIS